jgi:hypothetical protein
MVELYLYSPYVFIHDFTFTANCRLLRGKVVKVSLCLTDYALLHEGVWGSGCIDPHFLDLGTTWR